jgi:Asp-tRNA(Asn)/Glu-tRNA(Gln) amidotransferase A subunit family amidase
MSFLKRLVWSLSFLAVFSSGTQMLFSRVAEASAPETKSGGSSGGSHGACAARPVVSLNEMEN